MIISSRVRRVSIVSPRFVFSFHNKPIIPQVPSNIYGLIMSLAVETKETWIRRVHVRRIHRDEFWVESKLKFQKFILQICELIFAQFGKVGKTLKCHEILHNKRSAVNTLMWKPKQCQHCNKNCIKWSHQKKPFEFKFRCKSDSLTRRNFTSNLDETRFSEPKCRDFSIFPASKRTREKRACLAVES